MNLLERRANADKANTFYSFLADGEAPQEPGMSKSDRIQYLAASIVAFLLIAVVGMLSARADTPLDKIHNRSSLVIGIIP